MAAPRASGLGKTGSKGEAAAIETIKRCVTLPPNAAAGKRTQQSLPGDGVSASLTGSISWQVACRPDMQIQKQVQRPLAREAMQIMAKQCHHHVK